MRRFDTMGVQGKDFKADLLGPNSKPSKGLRKANLSPRTKALLEEVALSEQVLLSAAPPRPQPPPLDPCFFYQSFTKHCIVRD